MLFAVALSDHIIDVLRSGQMTVSYHVSLVILFAHENLAFCVRDILWRARRKILAVVTLQQGFSTQLSAKKCVHRMLGFHVRRVYP